MPKLIMNHVWRYTLRLSKLPAAKIPLRVRWVRHAAKNEILRWMFCGCVQVLCEIVILSGLVRRQLDVQHNYHS